MKHLIDGRVVEVTQDFLDWREDQKFEPTHPGGLDYLLLEHALLREGSVEKGYDIIHDFICADMRVDVKEVQNYFNVYGSNKIKWWNEGLDEGSLTHFLFVASDREGPLQKGDQITYSYIGLWEVQDVLEMLHPSFKVQDGFYIPTYALRRDE